MLYIMGEKEASVLGMLVLIPAVARQDVGEMEFGLEFRLRRSGAGRGSWGKASKVEKDDQRL